MLECSRSAQCHEILEPVTNPPEKENKIPKNKAKKYEIKYASFLFVRLMFSSIHELNITAFFFKKKAFLHKLKYVCVCVLYCDLLQELQFSFLSNYLFFCDNFIHMLGYFYFSNDTRPDDQNM